MTEIAKRDLVPQFCAAKSFYGKARVYQSGGWGQTTNLVSYDTLVARIGYGEDDELTAQVFNLESATTIKHVKEFLLQNGFRADNKKQIEADYFVEV